MRKKLKPKVKLKKESEEGLAINGTETASELYTRYIITQNPKIKQAWITKYKQEKGEKTK